MAHPRIPLTEFKNDLSACLRKVRKGQTLLLLHHGIPIAKVSPLSQAEQAAWSESLVCSGQMRPPKRELPADFFAPLSPPKKRAG
jgi:antitoxin (DNA-binding transcriptional repressor) of toxin-antitoxin stability system